MNKSDYPEQPSFTHRSDAVDLYSTAPSESSKASNIGRHCSWPVWKNIGIPILMGQVLAGLIAVTAICSTFLANNDVSLPLTQNLLHYGLLSFFYLSWKLASTILRKHHTSNSLSTCSTPRPVSRCSKSRLLRIGLYILTGLIDTHSNWCFVAAYGYTSVTSIQLLDCVTIPVSMLASCLFLHYRFSWTHYVSVLTCLLGAGSMIAADVLAHSPSPANTTSDKFPVENITQPTSTFVILGDFLVILGATGYGISNVLQQYLVIRYGIVNFLAYAGIAAFIPTLIFGLTIEWDGILRVFSPSSLIDRPLLYGCFGGYVAAMFALYTLMPYVLAKTNAVLVNLSLLTSDVYALLIGIYLFHYRFHALYIFCFIIILCGVGLFSIRTPTIRKRHCPCVPRSIAHLDSGSLAKPSSEL